MINDHETQNNDILISDATFWDLYPVDLSRVENVSVQSLPVSVRVTNLLMHNGVKTVADLYRMKVDDFIKLRGAGKKCYDETCKYLSDFSNRVVKLDPSLSTPKVAVCVPSIISENIENILNQDFSFCDDLNAKSDDLIVIEKYRDAVEVLGSDLARICYSSPNKILPLMDALNPFIKAQQERQYRKTKIHEYLVAIPEWRCSNNVYGYINAFAHDEELRESLYHIYNLDANPKASIKGFAFESIAESVTDYALLLNFLKWCTFDINKEIAELFHMLYSKSNSIKSVLLGRAMGETLGGVGEKMGITRERVRQIESQAKRIFSIWQSKAHILSKISAERNGDSVLSISELSEYFGDKYAEMVFLLRTSDSPAYYYDSQLDVFVMGDESTSAVIGRIIESLPDAFDEKKYNAIITEVVKEQNIPQKLIEKAIRDEFQKDGSTYHRTHLSLTTIYTEILEKYYPDGIDVYSENELQVFRYVAAEEYGCKNLPEKNRAISARLSDIGILCGRGKYRPKKKSYISKNLADKIYRYIVDSPSVIFMTNTLFNVFEDELLEFGIDNKYYLQGVLRELYDSEFVFRRDYISKNESVTSLYVEIVQYIKKFSYPIAKEDIKNAFPGVTEIVISFATGDANVINLFGKYIHGSRLNLTDSDKVYFERVIRKFVTGDKVRHYKELYDYIERDDSDLLRKLFIYFPTSLFSVLEYLFRDQYQFKRPFIANIGTDIGDPEEQLHDLIISSDEIAISEITAFAKDNHYEIYSILELLNSFNGTHLLMNRETLASTEYIGITDDIAENVIAILQSEIVETTLITALECIYRLPKINVPWTEWLVYSVVNKWGESIVAGTTSNQFKLSVPVVAPRGMLDVQKYEGLSVDTATPLMQVDDLDNIDDLISDFIEFDLDEDL